MKQGATASQQSPSSPHLTLHGRAFGWSVLWTLGLLLLGSIVHATESSLACPDWPTCFGTMVPEMSGGVFWEHLHRLVAGGLVLLWSAGTWFAFREAGTRPAVRAGAVVGLVLLIVQSLFGGLTVIMKLPDAVSTTHLALAFAFLSLATVLAVWSRPEDPNRPKQDTGPAATVVAAALVFVQSVVGAAVRHTDSGLACPDIPLCLGEWIPPLDQWPIGLHFTHRALAIATSVLVVAIALRAAINGTRPVLYLLAAVLVVGQVALGFLSVWSFLAVWAVSLHTLVAASLLATLVAAATLASSPPMAAQEFSHRR